MNQRHRPVPDDEKPHDICGGQMNFQRLPDVVWRDQRRSGVEIQIRTTQRQNRRDDEAHALDGCGNIPMASPRDCLQSYQAMHKVPSISADALDPAWREPGEEAEDTGLATPHDCPSPKQAEQHACSQSNAIMCPAQRDSDAVLPRIEEQRGRELVYNGECQQDMKNRRDAGTRDELLDLVF